MVGRIREFEWRGEWDVGGWEGGRVALHAALILLCLQNSAVTVEVNIWKSKVTFSVNLLLCLMQFFLTWSIEGGGGGLRRSMSTRSRVEYRTFCPMWFGFSHVHNKCIFNELISGLPFQAVSFVTALAPLGLEPATFQITGLSPVERTYSLWKQIFMGKLVVINAKVSEPPPGTVHIGGCRSWYLW